ncbi:CDP-glycerol glycerophosphotransferase family protein [Pullulanibacillus pueri]|uniref:CDP-glycerol glycerophosphotransferase family protein n=1 Tax=Pullulanibacillus pueri TaxID=1437324 RepID=UPI001E5E5C42|nr:CDP-glycerol glycerophosphotransferase family protein [Pullulanibacillus pueri]
MFRLQDKVTFVVSFPQNSVPLYKEMTQHNIPVEAVFLSKTSCADVLEKQTGHNVICFETSNVIDMLRSIYHLATSKHVVIDNYFGFLAAIQFKPEVKCVQLWHAVGAIKTFGFKDKSIKHRSERARERFEKVYNKFDKVVVGSEALAHIFMEAFHLPADKILRTGVPRTDFFYDVLSKQKVVTALYKKHPELTDKKVILYAPTYRDQELNGFKLKLDIEDMYKQLKDDYVLLLKLHPAIKLSLALDNKFDGFVYDFSGYPDINELLLITDVLITDYSSIPYEFSLLNKPMIFFPYDLEEYTRDRGLWGSYHELVPGPVVYDSSDIPRIIKQNKFDYNRIQEYCNKWNFYSKGNSSENLVNTMFGKEVLTVAQEAHN